VCGDSDAGAAEGLADAELREVRGSEAAVWFHAEEHGYGFVDGEAAKPIVGAAPRGERGNGERKLGWQPAPDVAHETRVERALGAAGVEVDLQSCDGGVGSCGVQDEIDGSAFETGRDFTGGFDADDRYALDSSWKDEGLPAWDDVDGAAEEDSAVERCDGSDAGIDPGEIFAALPDPEGAGWQRAHASGWGREIQGVRLETETTDE